MRGGRGLVAPSKASWLRAEPVEGMSATLFSAMRHNPAILAADRVRPQVPRSVFSGGPRAASCWQGIARDGFSRCAGWRVSGSNRAEGRAADGHSRSVERASAVSALCNARRLRYHPYAAGESHFSRAAPAVLPVNTERPLPANGSAAGGDPKNPGASAEGA